MDWSWFQTVNQWSADTPWAHGFFRAYANYGVAFFVVALALAVWNGLRDDPRVLARAIWAGVAAIIVLIVNQPIADAIGRVRPFAAHHGVLVLVNKSTDPGFLSDHAVMAGAVSVGLVFAVRRIGIVMIGAAVLMAFARVYVGAHYPGDVLAGLAFGGVVAAGGVPVADRLLTPICARLRSVPAVARLART